MRKFKGKKVLKNYIVYFDTLVSGSSILPNGKLVGAVTHVLVQDSSKGYGIFVEEMLKQCK